ncbi:probable rad16-nucleotide excision repairprotein [Lichtheimia corymbifera JMRC:FSU:9682]|uniref:Probable rad16-nucleotide excision repairprotein n=1 Tax=Lichtheimia corymbifera JMRC:FSU:9682 TaxID=1263082 RepID=A0A068SH98_9FUNG|nr:probable rad16-nucleotide excision repairprotein [Lichtheimia corymbifera JMRC:FSU:9682]
MVTTRKGALKKKATGSSSLPSQSGHTTPRSRREATSSSDRPKVITVLSDDDDDFQDLTLPARRRRSEPTLTTPVRSSKRLGQRDQGAAEDDRKGKRPMTLPMAIVSSDLSTTSTPTAVFRSTVREPLGPLDSKQKDVEPTEPQSIQQEHVLITSGQKDTLDNVAVRKGELDELGGAILKQSTAVATPQEDDEKPKDEEQDTNEGDGLDATSVKQDRNGGTLVHEEEALNATLENIKGTGSSSSSIDIGTSSATPGYDDTSFTTTAGTSNPNNIRQSVPSADTEAHDDEEEALLDRPLPRLSGAVNPLSVNINAERTTEKLLDYPTKFASFWDGFDSVIPASAEPIEQPKKLKLSLLPSQRHGVGWMRQQEGNNDDETGMGKTIQTIALLLSDEKRPNLVVAPPASALMHWKHEIEKHTDNALKVCIFDGDKPPTNARGLLNHDVVLTTYAVVEAAFRCQQYGRTKCGKTVKKEKFILYQVQWHRIILDEAHVLKSHVSYTARAVFNFEATFKWSLTDSPLQHRVFELYALVCFMQADPFAYYYCRECSCKSIKCTYSDGKFCDQCGHLPRNHTCWLRNEVLEPLGINGFVGKGRIAMEKLGKVMGNMMLRRTRAQCADDLGLPPREVVVRRDSFSTEEEEVYRSLFSDSARQFSAYVEQGSVRNNHANIFELLTNMRQCANHSDLVWRKTPADQQRVCMLCSDTPEDAVEANCHHIFCRECTIRYLASFGGEGAFTSQNPKCPICSAHFFVDFSQDNVEQDTVEQDTVEQDTVEQNTVEQNTVELQHEGGLHAAYAKTSIVNRINMDKWRSSTKIEALVEELSKVQTEDRTIKRQVLKSMSNLSLHRLINAPLFLYCSIVFSQFVNFLDLVYWHLSRAGFECIRLDGTMSPQQRDTAIKDCTVFLISLKASGVALNQVEASRVFICDPWWNPAVELRAMDRIHRLGQKRPIKVTRLIIENSIEDRIVQLQDKRTALVETTVGRVTPALDKLSAEDLQFLFMM